MVDSLILLYIMVSILAIPYVTWRYFRALGRAGHWSFQLITPYVLIALAGALAGAVLEMLA